MENNQCVVLRDEQGNLINLWRSYRQAAKDLGVSSQTIANIVTGAVRRSVKIKGILTIEELEINEAPIFNNLEGEE